MNLKESIVLAARGEIEATASVLEQAKVLEEHVNPPYLRGDPRFRSCIVRRKMLCTSVWGLADPTVSPFYLRCKSRVVTPLPAMS